MSEQVRDSYVSIHAPVKVRQETFLQGHDLVSFNSRTCEGATGGYSPARNLKSFNSRTCEGATDAQEIHEQVYRSFNSRTCEGATKRASRLLLACQVSIHAPVKVRHISVLSPLIH